MGNRGGTFHLLLVCLSPALLSAVRINGDGQEILYLAEGDNVRLGCPYILDPEDYGPNGLDIEWMQLNSDPSHRENVFLSYQDKRINHGNLPHLQQRVRFAASDPSQYDASINLMNLQVSDTATYECRVKKTTMASRKVIVTVQARPAVPMCWTEGHMAKGNDVVLKCFANGGTQPLSYKWAKISGHTQPYRAGSYHSQHSFHPDLSYQESFHGSMNQGMNNGDLVLKSISSEDDGLYQCTVANHVGYSVCVVEVKVSDSKRVGMIIGAVLGSLLMLACLMMGIWGLICCCCGGGPGAGGARGAFGYGNGVRQCRWGRGARFPEPALPRPCHARRGSPLTRACCFHREDAVAPGCKASGRGSRVTQLLGYPTQNVRRSLRRQYAPPPCAGPEDLALAPRNAACEAGPAPVYVKVQSAEPDSAQAPLPHKDGLLV
ncbi:PREDICTED: V-set and immunoglobulin domain-containing protein 8 [Condylura cristata]|uniref:V-set and immunoglobulin domain-containing protein 8 n=1 Tax=Condylura cristata TaxID=143302 RepID=UPI000643B432|nr:PREDICTED: V-set and immunoglobulin domain-containing protein 8 [Condylura cristata]